MAFTSTGSGTTGSLWPDYGGTGSDTSGLRQKWFAARGFTCGRYWVRTSDLFRVREARYRCANRPRWRRDLNPRTRICSPLPRLSATPPQELRSDRGLGEHCSPQGLGETRSERTTGFEPATLTLAR